MNKYKVKISHLFSEILDVEAQDEQGARTKAQEILKEQGRQAELNYEATIEEENWPVITEEQFQDMMQKAEAELAKQKEPSNIITP